MFKRFHIIWLILPSVVFFLLVAAFVVKLGKNQPSSTEVAAPTPTPISFPQTPPAAVEGISSLVFQIQGWQVTDQRLAAPAVDRKISLPAE